MIKILISIFMMSLFAYADTTFAKPLPSIDNPRKIVFSIHSGDEETINHVLSSANNVLMFYGPEKVNMEIVAYYHGIEAVLKKNKEIASRVDTLMQYDVKFIACGNTMQTKHIKKEELIDGVEVVTAGIVEVTERVQDGWVYIVP